MGKKITGKKSIVLFNTYNTLIATLLRKKLSEVNTEDVTLLLKSLRAITKNKSVLDEIKHECISKTEPIIWVLTLFKYDIIRSLCGVGTPDSSSDEVNKLAPVLREDAELEDICTWMHTIQDIDIQCRAMLSALNNVEFSSVNSQKLLRGALRSNAIMGSELQKYISLPKFDNLMAHIATLLSSTSEEQSV